MSDAKPEHRGRSLRSGPSSGSFKVARVEVQELAALPGPEVPSGAGQDLMSDEMLVARVLRGEPGPYNVLMRRTAARLYRIARGIAGSPARAEEIVRDSYVRAYENLSSFDQRSRFSDWLGRITIHGSLASLKRDGSESPHDLARGGRSLELVRQLEDAVDVLPRPFRVAFTLCVLDQMPPADVALALGAEQEDVRVGSFRGRLLARRRLGMRFDDAESRAFGLDLATLASIIHKVHTRLGIGVSVG